MLDGIVSPAPIRPARLKPFLKAVLPPIVVDAAKFALRRVSDDPSCELLGFSEPYDGTDLWSSIERIKAHAARHLAGGVALRNEIKNNAARLAVESFEMGVIVRDVLAKRGAGGGVSSMKDVSLVVFDFDGVMTDNRVRVHQSGDEAVWCHRGDGLGIARLKEAGFEIVVLSTETNPVVAARCRKLKIEAIHGCDDKRSALQHFARERNLTRGANRVRRQ